MAGTEKPGELPRPVMRTTLASLVEDWQQWGTGTAVVMHRGNRAHRINYGDLATLAGRFAAELERRQVAAGERVILWGENSAAWIAAFFGCLLRGVLVVPLDAAGSAGFAARVVAEVVPCLVVGDAALIQKLETPLAKLALEELAYVLPDTAAFAVDAAVTEETPFQIVFTSGTTAEPKGVVHTHRNVLASLRPIETEIGKYKRYERWFHPLRFLHTLPFSHVFGQFMGLWIPAVLGAEIYLPASVDPGRLLAQIKRERISVLVAVPRVLDLLRGYLLGTFPQLEGSLAKSVGVSAWKRWWRFRAVHRAFGWKFWALICGGATLPADLEAFWNGLGFALVQGYGLTETAALVTLNHPFKVGRGTLGKALPGREVKLSEQGEILVRGDVLAAGTWHAGRFEPRGEEWLATGDLASQDAGGELRFAGRRGDVIVTSAGLNVHPADVEAALLKQPGMRGCAVVGCDAGNGPEPVGVAVYSGSAEELRGVAEQANRELAPYQQVRHLFAWPEPQLPYTSTGKLLRRQVAAWACAQLDGGAAAEEVGGEDVLLQLVAEVTRQTPTRTDDASRLTEDLHLDSLGRVQLQSALEQRFGVELRDEEVGGVETLGGLRALVRPSASPASARSEADLPRHDPGASSPMGLSRAAVTVTYPRWPWSRPVQWLRAAFLEMAMVPLVYLLAKPRVRPEQELAEDRPMLLIANHVNTFDLPLLLYALRGRRRRWVATAMSSEVLGDLRRGRGQGNFALNALAQPAYWLLMTLFNVFPLPRLSGFRESFAHAGEALDRGYSVLVFPEGRRGWTGDLQPFRPGIGLLVQASQVAVLPMALQGVGAAAREGRSWFRSGAITVQVGRPLLFSRDSSPEEITRQLEMAVRSLGPS